MRAAPAKTRSMRIRAHGHCLDQHQVELSRQKGWSRTASMVEAQFHELMGYTYPGLAPALSCRRWATNSIAGV